MQHLSSLLWSAQEAGYVEWSRRWARYPPDSTCFRSDMSTNYCEQWEGREAQGSRRSTQEDSVTHADKGVLTSPARQERQGRSIPGEQSRKAGLLNILDGFYLGSSNWHLWGSTTGHIHVLFFSLIQTGTCLSHFLCNVMNLSISRKPG